jgi:hypothetical protein
MLIVGYVDNAASPGGGYFLVRNSLGEAWGNRGYGKLPYAYVACFALEAGTILQDLVDYTGDGYGGLRPDASFGPQPRRPGWFTFLNVLVAIALVVGTWAAVTWYQQRNPSVPAESPAPSRPPFAEVTVYGRDATVNVTLPPPWHEVKGLAIDGGMLFRLPAKSREEVDAIRRQLDAEPTLREKRGKPLTYDLVTFYDLAADDLDDVRKTIGMFAAEHFLVRIEGESNGVLRVSTISPRGFRERLKQVYDLRTDDGGRMVLTSKIGETRPRVFAEPEKRAITNAPPPVVPETAVPPATNAPPPVAQEAPGPPATTVVQQGRATGRGNDF